MIGQTNLLNKLNSYSIDSFPRSTLIIGEKGSGKHTIADYIKTNILKLSIIDITENISDEYIDEIYRTSTPNIYLIDLTKMTEKEQNILLKFIEEPLKNAFIILLAESRNFVLNTVLNRCVTFDIQPYSISELKTFIPSDCDSDKLLEIIKTPGQLKLAINTNFGELEKLCNTIADKLNASNYMNALTIVDKINYKDEYNKFDLNLFFNTLVFTLFSKYKESNNKLLLDMYLLTREQREKLIDKRLNKELFMTNFITKLWKLSRGV